MFFLRLALLLLLSAVSQAQTYCSQTTSGDDGSSPQLVLTLDCTSPSSPFSLSSAIFLSGGPVYQLQHSRSISSISATYNSPSPLITSLFLYWELQPGLIHDHFSWQFNSGPMTIGYGTTDSLTAGSLLVLDASAFDFSGADCSTSCEFRAVFVLE